MKMIGWWPSFRVTVADKPVTNFAFARRTTCSKLWADRWWHSSTIDVAVFADADHRRRPCGPGSG